MSLPAWVSRRNVHRVLAVIACLALVLALCLPAVRGRREVFNVQVAVDITQSMNVPDYQLDGVPVSRLAFARHALHEGLLQLPCGSKLGLSIFTERRTFILFTPVEVCRNRDELTAAIDALSGRMAWANASQIALGLHGALKLASALPGRPDVVFLTDGHESPPVNARYRPRFDGTPGEVHGFIVGVGGRIALPIPKLAPDGQALGVWGAEDVQQTDIYSRGRAGSLSGEQMADSGGSASPLPVDQPAGAEQLSALHEHYLELLASETGLRYQRLTAASDLTAALTDRAAARHEPAPTDIRWVWGATALVALLALSLPARTPTPSIRWRQPARERGPPSV